MTTSLTFSTDRRPDGSLVLAAAGEIDMSNADAFGTALSTALTGGGEPAGGPLVVDLTAVEYLDSAGLAALFPYAEQVRLIATPLLVPLLTIVGLDDITTVSPG